MNTCTKVEIDLGTLISYASAVEGDLTFDEVRYMSEDYENYAYCIRLDTTYFYPNPEGAEYSHEDYTFVAMSQEGFQRFADKELSAEDRETFAKEDWIGSETEEPGRKVVREVTIERNG